VSHASTIREPRGGEFGQPLVSQLDWPLRHNAASASMLAWAKWGSAQTLAGSSSASEWI
jgi:hypothetical protein